MKCKYCGFSNQDNDFILETACWKILLSENQHYLGRCVIVLKRHCENLSELKQEEWIDFAEVVNKLEASLKEAFNAPMFNWTCMMNNDYKLEKPNPHVHWHLRPRYKSKIEFNGLFFEDAEFGHHYDRTKTKEVSCDVQKKIIEKIRKNL